MGRFVIYTEAAFAKLDTMYGAGTSKGALPTAEMTNADLARIINSDEVQSVVNPAKAEATKFLRKKNAIKSIKALEKISPYAAAARKSETRAQEARKTKKTKSTKVKRTAALKASGQKFYEKVSAQGDVCLGGFNA